MGVDLSAQSLLLGYARDLLFMTVMCFFGVFIATYIIEKGLGRRIKKVFAPLMHAANLPKELSIPAMVSMLEFRAGHFIVSSLRSQGLSDEAIITYSLVMRPVVIFLFMFKFYLPIIIPAVGLHVGLFYIALSLVGSFVVMVIGIIYGRVKIRRGMSFSFPTQEEQGEPRKDIGRFALKKALSMLKYVMKRYLVVLAIMAILLMVGFFNWLKEVVGNFTHSLGFSPEFAMILSVQTVSPLTGIIAAGEILKAGLIDVRETLLALVLGNFLFLLIFGFLRYPFPFYVSVYPVKLATKLIIVGILTNLISKPLLIVMILVFT